MDIQAMAGSVKPAGKPGWVPAGGREFETGSKGVDAILIEIKRVAAPK